MVTISGYVDHIIYQNEENGYTVMELVTRQAEKEGEELLTCVGTCKGLNEGENIEAEGDYTEHAVYGRQFKIASYRTVAPKDIVSIERYLGSGAIKGIGPTMAARIVQKFGEDAIRIMEEEPERLAEIKGISIRKAREIAMQTEEKRELRDALIFLQRYGISNNLAVKIYNTYGMELYGIMRENPYRLAEDISGIGFKIADEIAERIGIHADSDYRIQCGVVYTLQQALAEGHCYLPLEVLLDKSRELLGVPQEAIEPLVRNLTMDKKLVIKGDHVYTSGNYHAELNCAFLLHQLNLSFRENETALRKRVEEIVRKDSKELDELQLKAVMGAIQNGLFILSGGPGTGKTTTINTIIQYFAQEGLDIFLAAPTGRAAKRMTETTGYEARTIHRMLELNGIVDEEDRHRARFERNADNPLEADVIIIDEMSMVDLMLFQSLLRAITPGTRLILVGDVDQLPSVGAGQVLRDIINSDAFATVCLQKIYRQAGESDIIVNAHKINKGEQISLDNKSRDFFLLERNDVNVIYKHMILLIKDKLPSYVNAGPFDIQVLTPMRKGALGIEVLNGILQQYLNPPEPGKAEYINGDTIYRVGDKVMQTKNNYQIEWEVVSKYGICIDRGTGVFNGDMGRVVEIREALSELVVEFDEGRKVTYPFSGLDELELSYAITIHKSQGSEYPAVILPLLTGPRMLFNRNLLYTGVTRAKNCVTIIGSSETVRGMIDNESENKRYTSLAERITELAQQEK